MRARAAAVGAPVVALVCLGIFMTTLDASIVNIGLPSIARAFQTPLTGTVEWIIIGYLLVIGGLLLTFGRLSDVVGRAPIWTAGLVIFTAGSALCGAAPSLRLLIAARALQGVGGALILSTSAALISGAVPASQRGHALGWGALAIALGGSAGPTIGGLLTAYGTWRWIFYVNIPIGLVAIAASWWLLAPRLEHSGQQFDPWGAVLLAIALAALNVGLSFGQEWGWSSVPLLGVLSVGVAALVAGAVVESRSTQPLIDVRLFRDRDFFSAVASLLCAMVALFAIGFLFPFYFEGMRGFSPERAGLMLTPFPLAMAIVAPGAGALSDRVGSRWLAPLALAITTVALLLLTQVDATTSMPAIAWRLALAGAGLGLFQSPNTRALMDAAPASEQGMASGVFATSRVTGQALSVAIAGAVFGGRGLAGLHAAFITCASFAALGALLALLRTDERARPESGIAGVPNQGSAAARHAMHIPGS